MPIFSDAEPEGPCSDERDTWILAGVDAAIAVLATVISPYTYWIASLLMIGGCAIIVTGWLTNERIYSGKVINKRTRPFMSFNWMAIYQSFPQQPIYELRLEAPDGRKAWVGVDRDEYFRYDINDDYPKP